MQGLTEKIGPTGFTKMFRDTVAEIVREVIKNEYPRATSPAHTSDGIREIVHTVLHERGWMRGHSFSAACKSEVRKAQAYAHTMEATRQSVLGHGPQFTRAQELLNRICKEYCGDFDIEVSLTLVEKKTGKRHVLNGVGGAV